LECGAATPLWMFGFLECGGAPPLWMFGFLECGGAPPLWMFGFLDGEPTAERRTRGPCCGSSHASKDPKRCRATALQERAGESSPLSESDESLSRTPAGQN